MANQRKPMHLIRHLLQLQKEGKSIRQMSRLLCISRNTVRHYLRQLADASPAVLLEEQSGQQLEGLLKKSESGVTSLNRYRNLESRFEVLEKELVQPGVNRYVLWLEYKQQIPEGYQYSQFCYHYQQWQRSRQATLHLEHKAGDKLFVDFAGEKLHLTDPVTGALEPVEVFVAILGCSQLTYVSAVRSQSKADFLSCLASALHYFGGVPEAIVPDNLKSAVTKADRYEPELNELLTDFALHYQTVILPTRVAKPRDKALVEGAVNIVYSRVYAPLRKRVFTSLQELNFAISELVVFQQLDEGYAKSFSLVFTAISPLTLTLEDH